VWDGWNTFYSEVWVTNDVKQHQFGPWGEIITGISEENDSKENVGRYTNPSTGTCT
jgi:hypothetical protein